MNLFAVSMQDSDKVILKSFTIENYRAIENETIELNSERGIVFSGESGVGKTTRIEALLWLLTGKLFDGSTNGLETFIMPKNATEDTVLSVGATFVIGMETFVLEKKIKQKWTKKRGTDEVVYEGVELAYYVNGVKKTTAKEFQRAIQVVFGLENAIAKIEKETKLLAKVDLLMLLTVLDFFPSLDNKTLRELVLLVAGDVNVAELPMSDSLREVLKKYNFDLDVTKKELKLKLKGDKFNVGLYSKLENIDSQLATHRKTLDGIGSLDDVEKAKLELTTVRESLASVNNGLTKPESDYTIDLDNQIKALELELQSINLEKRKEMDDDLQKLDDELKDLRDKYANFQREIGERQNKIDLIHQSVAFNESSIEGLKERGRTLVEQKKLIKAQNQITCPQCQHVFTLQHEHDNLVEIDEKLKELREKIGSLENSIKDFTDEEIKLNGEIEKLVIERDKVKTDGITLSDIITKRKEAYVETRNSDFKDEHELDVIQRLNGLKRAKNTLSVDVVSERANLRTQKTNLETRELELLGIISNEKTYQNAFSEIERLQKERTETQKVANALEQIEIEVKVFEEEYLKAIDEKMLNAFGDNIRFKMFETNLSNDNLAPVCEMYVKDSFGRWVNVINGINTGHSVPRLVEFIVKVRHALGIRDGILLIDFFESIGNEPLQELLTYNQTIVATQVVRNQNELKVEIL